jgi:hypothetical protein
MYCKPVLQYSITPYFLRLISPVHETGFVKLFTQVHVDDIVSLPGGGTAVGGSSGSTIHQVYKPSMSCR